MVSLIWMSSQLCQCRGQPEHYDGCLLKKQSLYQHFSCNPEQTEIENVHAGWGTVGTPERSQMLSNDDGETTISSLNSSAIYMTPLKKKRVVRKHHSCPETRKKYQKIGTSEGQGIY